MSHYAQVKNSIVQQVIVAEQQYIDTRSDAQDWIQTSYNTFRNQHPEGRPLRGNYAGLGSVYDAESDVFYEPQPWASWSLNTTTWSWEPPRPYPQDGNAYSWNESTQTWTQQHGN